MTAHIRRLSPEPLSSRPETLPEGGHKSPEAGSARCPGPRKRAHVEDEAMTIAPQRLADVTRGTLVAETV
jgi:hypothetical protein